MAISELVLVLQQAVSPMILISGAGLILLSMTNRLGRTIDRSRVLSGELTRCPDADRAKIKAQLKVLWRRAKLGRVGILLAAASALFAAVLILTLFLVAELRLEVGWLVAALFIACLVCLIASLVTFTHDINLSLSALRVELGEECVRERLD